MNEALDEVIQRWDEASVTFDTKPGHGVRSEAEKLAWINLFTQQAGSPKKILDVGTGTGEMALLLAELGHEVTGVDLSEGMMGRAREKAKQAGLSVTFQSDNAEQLSFKETSFDLVLCRHLLWQLHHPEKALTDWLRVLKPGGKVLSIEGRWKGGSLGERFRGFIANFFLYAMEGRTRWRMKRANPKSGGISQEEAAEAFKTAGFVDVTIDSLAKIIQAERDYMTFNERMAYPGKRYMIWGRKG